MEIADAKTTKASTTLGLRAWRFAHKKQLHGRQLTRQSCTKKRNPTFRRLFKRKLLIWLQSQIWQLQLPFWSCRCITLHLRAFDFQYHGCHRGKQRGIQLVGMIKKTVASMCSVTDIVTSTTWLIGSMYYFVFISIWLLLGSAYCKGLEYMLSHLQFFMPVNLTYSTGA